MGSPAAEWRWRGRGSAPPSLIRFVGRPSEILDRLAHHGRPRYQRWVDHGNGSLDRRRSKWCRQRWAMWSSITLAVVEIGRCLGLRFRRTRRGPGGEQRVGAGHRGGGRLLASRQCGDGMFWSAGVVVTAGDGRGLQPCLDERKAPTGSRRGSRPVGAGRSWLSLPVGRRRPRTAVPADVIGGARAQHSAAVVGRGWR